MPTGLRIRSKVAFWVYAHSILSKCLALGGTVSILALWYRHSRKVEKTHAREWRGTFKPSFVIFFIIRTYFNFVTKLAALKHRVEDWLAGKTPRHSVQARALRTFFGIAAGVEVFDLKTFRTPFSALINEIPDEVVTDHVTFDEEGLFDAFWISLDSNTSWRSEKLGLPNHKPVASSLEQLKGGDMAVMWIHGGGFMSGDLAGFKAVCYKVSELLDGTPVFFPNYRMAPEHSLKDSVRDCMLSYEYLISNFSRVAIIADSAGGCLALHLLQQVSLGLVNQRTGISSPLSSTIPSPSRIASEEGELPIRRKSATLDLKHHWSNPHVVREPNCAVLLSPVTDLTAETIQGAPKTGVMLNKVTLQTAYDHAVGDECPLTLSPLHAPEEAWVHIPPLYVAAADDEILFEDSKQLVENAKVHGVEVEAHFCTGVFHTWPVFWQHHPEGEASLKVIASYISRKCEDNKV